ERRAHRREDARASPRLRAGICCIRGRAPGKMSRTSFATLAVVIALCGAATDASAQVYPTKAIRLVVGFAPGGAADTVARAIGDQLGKVLGQPIIIENRAGAGSSIAAETVAHSPPDGYTMLIASPASISVNPAPK